MDPLIEFPNGECLKYSEITASTQARCEHLSPWYEGDNPVTCLCRKTGIPVGVARRTIPQDTYYLYSLHHSDKSRHAQDCPLRLVREQAEEGAPKQHETIVNVDHGIVDVHLKLPAYCNPPREINVPPGRSHAADKQARTRAVVNSSKGTLNLLLELLWSESELNLWRSYFAGRRFYGTVRDRLQTVFERISVNGAPIKPLIYIPPVYKEEDAAALNAQFTGFLASLSPDARGRRPYGYLLGAIRGVETLEDGSLYLQLTHHASAVWVPAELVLRVPGYFKPVARSEGKKAVRVVLMHVLREGVPDQPWLSCTDIAALDLFSRDTWLPFSTELEYRLLQALVKEGRAFRRPVSIEQETGLPLPSYILEDRRERTCLEIMPDFDTASAGRKRRSATSLRRQQYAQLKQDVWWWNPSDSEDINLPVANIKPVAHFSRQGQPAKAVAPASVEPTPRGEAP